MIMRRRLRASRRTNLALIVLVPGALATGILAFGMGSGWALWVVVAHGVVGFAVLVMSPWKLVISRRGLRRRAPSRTWASLLLGVAIIVVVTTGVAHSTGLALAFGPLTTMQIHVGAAFASMPLFVWHVFARRVAPRATDLSRRGLLRSGAVVGASAAVYGGVALVANAVSLPGAERRFSGSYETARFDAASLPVTQWLDDTPPSADTVWPLTVRSPAETRAWTLGELTGFGDRRRATLDCTGGWYSTQDWEGVFLSRLLPDLGQSRSILVRSATGYWRRFPASEAGTLLLAVRAGGEAISEGHGAPLRLVAPARRGFWWVKWVTSIEANDVPWWWQPPFPLT
jgi:hypothetical protein